MEVYRFVFHDLGGILDYVTRDCTDEQVDRYDSVRKELFWLRIDKINSYWQP